MIDIGAIFPLFLMPAAFLLFVSFLAFLVSRLIPYLSARSGIDLQPDVDFIPCDSLLTPAERSFYGVLSQAIESTHVIFPKVRVADVLNVKGSKDRQANFNKIAMKHFDFVVCDSQTFAPQYVVELNDSSHLNQSRKLRDEFLYSVCRSAGIPFIQMKVQTGYSVAAVAGIIRAELTESLT
jgi:hypothetical protein